MAQIITRLTGTNTLALVRSWMRRSGSFFAFGGNGEQNHDQEGTIRYTSQLFVSTSCPFPLSLCSKHQKKIPCEIKTQNCSSASRLTAAHCTYVHTAPPARQDCSSSLTPIIIMASIRRTIRRRAFIGIDDGSCSRRDVQRQTTARLLKSTNNMRSAESDASGANMPVTS
jgi:hypothetical protein